MTEQPIRIPLSRVFTHMMLAGAVFFLLMHLVISMIHCWVVELPWLFQQLFDLDEENNFPTWFSGFLLVSTSYLIWVCALGKQQQKDRWTRHWFALAIGFFLLSIDEIAGLHETINSVIEMSWYKPGAAIIFIVSLPFVHFLINLPRAFAIVAVIGGIIYLGGLIGVEMIGEDLIQRDLDETMMYQFSTFVEEGMEMIGIIIFQYGLFAYMGKPIAVGSCR